MDKILISYDSGKDNVKRHYRFYLQSFSVLFVIMLSSLLGFSQQNYQLKGVIVDAKTSAPLPGATIRVEGTTIGASADVDGNYTLDVPANTQKIEVTFIGYQKKVIVFKANELNVFRVITLFEDAQELEDVTVVAFAKQKKESVVGAVTTVNVGDLKVPSSNLTTSFAGRIAGMISYQTSGEPGNDNAKFFVRGVTTFGTGKADPLILIDNIELSSSDLARLNTDDIESFSVLKDATATALYGARGANGVILVTTKEGKEGAVKVNFRYEASVSASTRDVEVSDPITFMELHNEAVRTRDPLGALPYSASSIEARKNGANKYVYPQVDWKDMLIKNSTLNQRGNLNLGGGGKVARYYVALGYSRDNGLLRVDKVNNFNNNITLNKYNVRSNVNINLTGTTELSVKVSGSFDDYQGPMSGGAAMYNNAIKSNPVLFPAYYKPDAANKYANHILFGNYGTDGEYMNPYAEMLRGYKEYNSTTVIAQLELNQDLKFITEGLKFRIMGNVTSNSYFDVQRYYTPFYYNIGSYDKYSDVYQLTALNATNGTDYLSYSQSDGTRTVNREFYSEMQLNYQKTFDDIHDVGGMLIFTSRESLTGNAQTLHESLASRNLNLSGRFTYGYDNRYFAELNFGYNGSEKFNKNHRWGFFPSAGISWMISNEKFFEDTPVSQVLTSLKFKATYGLVGNDAISNDRFFYLSEVNMNNSGKGYSFGYNFGESKNGISISRYADDNIGWEVSHKFDAGIVANLWNKVDVEFDYFTEKRKNILMTRADIPSTMGLQAIPKANIGEAYGHGVDLSVNASHFFTNDFWVKVMGNFTFATSEFKTYEEPDYSLTTPWLSHENQKISQTWGLIAERLFVDEADVENSPAQQFGEYMAGDIKYKDINDDGKIDNRDFVPMGYPSTPEITYGFGASLGYKGLDFSLFFQGNARSSFYVSPSAISPFVNSLSGKRGNNAVLKFIEKSHWSEENQDIYAAWPRLSEKLISNNNQQSSWWLHNGSFIRLKSMELGYTLPKDKLSKAYIQSLRVYLSGTNLCTWSKFDLWDIEMGNNGLGYPNQRVFNLGLQISF